MEPPSGRKELTVGQRGDVVGQRKRGASFGAIAVDLEISEDTARKVWIYYKHTGSYELPPNHRGRPPSLSERDRRHVHRFIKNGCEERRLPLNTRYYGEIKPCGIRQYHA
jgi:transposase